MGHDEPCLLLGPWVVGLVVVPEAASGLGAAGLGLPAVAAHLRCGGGSSRGFAGRLRTRASAGGKKSW